jgi:hypothetical protein
VSCVTEPETKAQKDETACPRDADENEKMNLRLGENICKGHVCKRLLPNIYKEYIKLNVSM